MKDFSYQIDTNIIQYRQEEKKEQEIESTPKESEKSNQDNPINNYNSIKDNVIKISNKKEKDIHKNVSAQ